MRKPTFFGWYILVVFVLMCLMALLVSCRTQYVTVPEYHTEYVSKTDTFIQRDSIRQHDSIYVAVKGDTVTVERYSILYRDRLCEKAVHDTIIKTDSVRVPYPVEKQLTRWQQMKVDFGEYAFVFVAIALLVFILRKKKDVIMRV